MKMQAFSQRSPWLLLFRGGIAISYSKKIPRILDVRDYFL
jgi:hypothetical protein